VPKPVAGGYTKQTALGDAASGQKCLQVLCKVLHGLKLPYEVSSAFFYENYGRTQRMLVCIRFHARDEGTIERPIMALPCFLVT
jgi:hypothetical protein